jgi:hypothetical protein
MEWWMQFWLIVRKNVYINLKIHFQRPMESEKKDKNWGKMVGNLKEKNVLKPKKSKLIKEYFPFKYSQFQ